MNFGSGGCRLAALAIFACAGCGELYWVCDGTDGASTADPPAKLSATGLFSDIEIEALGEGVVPYRPQFELRTASDLPERNAVGVTPVLGGRGEAWIFQSFGVALDAHAAFDAAAPVAWRRDASRVQLVVQPGVHWRIGATGLVAADLLFPIGGALGGSAFAAGIRVAGSL